MCGAWYILPSNNEEDAWPEKHCKFLRQVKMQFSVVLHDLLIVGLYVINYRGTN